MTRRYFKYFFVAVSVSFCFSLFLIKNFNVVTWKSENYKVQCGRLPKEENITINNFIWQVLEIPKGFYKLMNAYLDERENKTIVRVSVIGGDQLDIKTDVIYCQFWFDEVPGTQPTVVKATQFIMMWPKS